MRKSPSEKILALWKETIKDSGIKRIRLRALLSAFGYARRGENSVHCIAAWLKEHDLYARGLEAKDLDSCVTLSDHEMTQLGAMADEEKAVYGRFVPEIMPKLGLTGARPNYSPKGTRDRFDFLCEDADGRSVVVEIKRAGGEKHGLNRSCATSVCSSWRAVTGNRKAS